MIKNKSSNSFKEELLKKFKESLQQEEKPKWKKKTIVLKKESDESEIEEIQTLKKNIVLKSEEISVNIGQKYRAVLRNFPSMVEEIEVLTTLKKSIERANLELDEENQIKESPLKIYDKLVSLGVLTQDEMDEDDFEEKEAAVLQNFNDDDFTEDDNAYDAEMRRDIEKGKAEEIIGQMGTDWRKHDEDFYSSNY